MSVSSPEIWSDASQRRHLRRNYLALAFDGGFYAAGVAFVAVESVLPSLLKELGAPNWLVALAPTLNSYGFFLLPMFTAHWYETLTRFKPAVAWISVPQRLPPLIAGLALLLLAQTHRDLVLWIVAFSPLTIGFFGGLNIVGFFELYSKVLPANRRSSNLGLRNILGTSLGFVAGSTIVTTVLARMPGVGGYGVLYLFNFVCFMFSLAALCFVKETPHVPGIDAGLHGLRGKLRLLPQWWRDDPVMRNFILARVFGTGTGMLTPFLAIHAREVLDKPPSFLGHLVAAQMAGVIAGNLLGGWLGDRVGGRIVAQIGGLAAIALSVATLFNRSEPGFLAMFVAVGVTISMSYNGAMTMLLEICSPDRRPTYLALTSIATLPAMLLCATVAGLMRERLGALWPVAIVAAVLLVASQWFYHRLPEPRSAGGGAAA